MRGVRETGSDRLIIPTVPESSPVMVPCQPKVVAVLGIITCIPKIRRVFLLKILTRGDGGGNVSRIDMLNGPVIMLIPLARECVRI